MRMRARLTAASKLKKNVSQENVSQEKETRYITALLSSARPNGCRCKNFCPTEILK